MIPGGNESQTRLSNLKTNKMSVSFILKYARVLRYL